MSETHDLRGLGKCHQQAFCEDRPCGRLVKFANLYKFALLASQTLPHIQEPVDKFVLLVYTVLMIDTQSGGDRT